MAQNPSVMIFPPVRISQLEKDFNEKEAAFKESANRFASTLEKKLSPLEFVWNNRKWIIGSIISVISSTGFIRKLFVKTVKKKKGTILWTLIKTAGIWRGFKFIGKHGLKNLIPLMGKLGKTTLFHILKKR